MTRHSIEPRIRKYVKGYRFLKFPRNLSNKYEKKLLNTATIQAGIGAAKTASKSSS